ncbi:MAG: hypothetical protein FWC27_00295, partial [Firmicutes bacterium]|nr:hypothetical protein [Bacillota bacterium]
MSKWAKRILSLTLAALLLTCFFQPAFAEGEAPEQALSTAPAAGEDVSKYPLIFGAGAWHPLYTNEERWLPKSLAPGSPMETVFSTENTLGGDAGSMGSILSSLTSLDMDAFGDGLVQLWENSYGSIAMDADGKSINPAISCVIPYLTYLGTKYSTFTDNPAAYAPLDETMNKIKAAGALGENKAFWTFDWRQSPVRNADLLHAYIEKLIGLYGEGNTHDGGNHNGYAGEPFDKVNFNAISGSGPIALAYLKKYGHLNRLSSLVFNISMHNGSSLFGNIALGDFGFDAASLAQGGLSMFGLQDSKVGGGGDKAIFGLSPRLIEGLYQLGLLDTLLNAFNFAARGAYKKFYEQALIPIWFQMPAYLCMIPNKDYEAAKKYLFKDDPKYAKLLADADEYHAIMAEQDDLILKAAAKLKVAVRCGYGSPLSPYAVGANVSSDKLVDTYYASLGATCAAPGRPFSIFYRQKKFRDTRDYISPDRCVDASTCLLPDVTWFAKGLPHTAQWDYSGWYGWWLAAKDYTIRDNEKYPQYSQWIAKA